MPRGHVRMRNRHLVDDGDDVPLLRDLVSDPEQKEIVGGGWIETGWPEGRFLQRSDIDPVSGAFTATVYTRPWTIATRFGRGHIKDANYELWEDACHEGERSADKMIIPANVLKENEDRAKAVTQNK